MPDLLMLLPDPLCVLPLGRRFPDQPHACPAGQTSPASLLTTPCLSWGSDPLLPLLHPPSASSPVSPSLSLPVPPLVTPAPQPPSSFSLPSRPFFNYRCTPAPPPPPLSLPSPASPNHPCNPALNPLPFPLFLSPPVPTLTAAVPQHLSAFAAAIVDLQLVCVQQCSSGWIQGGGTCHNLRAG